MKTRSRFVTAIGEQEWRCDLCPHRCRLGLGELGRCGTRRNDGAGLEVLTHGRLLATALDPIEKKPLFHYHPGSTTFSVASAGCNLICPFCQNHTLSQAPRCRAASLNQAPVWTAAEVVAAAQASRASSISFTYSEPILMLDFALEVAELAQPVGLEVVFVTNGQASREALDELCRFVRAANVDLKGWSEDTYRHVLGGHRGATLSTIEALHAAGAHVEVTTLVIPGFNDSDEELLGIAHALVRVSSAIPWHVSRFHGAFEWAARQATPIETLSRARQIGLGAGLKFVYTGNVPNGSGENTACPACGALVIERRGFTVTRIALRDGRCDACGERIAGMGLP